ncbi:MAG: hypothetical protein OXU40_00525 [Nitrospira sp.]|nr:hypothetical protein [Nitrospira sp.]
METLLDFFIAPAWDKTAVAAAVALVCRSYERPAPGLDHGQESRTDT